MVIGRIVLLLHHRTEGLSVLMAMLRSLLPGSNHRAAYPRVAGFPESTSKCRARLSDEQRTTDGDGTKKFGEVWEMTL